MTTITIGHRQIGQGQPTFIIAEVAQAHDGSLGTAHAYIDAVAATGADAIKFQTHLAEFESTLDERFRIPFSLQDANRYAYWKRVGFTEEQWAGLARHAADKGLVFLSSVFCVEAVHLLQRVGMPAWKLGSGEFRSTEILDAIEPTGAPVLFSTGMSSYQEIESTAHEIRRRNLPLAMLQCTSRYPTPLHEVGLNVVSELRRRFDCPVGLSDHSGSVFPGAVAMARGADLLEVHVVFDRRLFGPDTPASVTIEELKFLADTRSACAVMDQHPVDKDAMAGEMSAMRELFTKSLAPARCLTAGTVITEDMLVAKKPGSGIPSSEKNIILGRRLARDVRPDRLLSWEDIHEE